MNLVIGVTGSVATIKLTRLIEEFQGKCQNISIKIVCTNNSLHFLKDLNIPECWPRYTDQCEWDTWSKYGDPVLHIELRNWADVLLIAPMDANTMAKISNGLCDNLLTCLLRAWNMKEKGKFVFLAPAMNTAMWEHPISKLQINLLESFGYNIIMPIDKKLACGDIGIGGMAEVESIVEKIVEKNSQ